MEPPEPTSAKFKLWRWLLLASVITVGLGCVVLWNARRERLQFVEPIWSDSLTGHGNESATGQRRKIGEVWSLTHSSGFVLFDRGKKFVFEGRYPVLTTGNQFHQQISEQLLADQRFWDARATDYELSYWWEGIKDPAVWNHYKLEMSFEVLFVADRAVSVRRHGVDYWKSKRHGYSTWGDSFVARNGAPHKLELNELFHGSNWEDAISDFCLADLRQQGVPWAQPAAGDSLRVQHFNEKRLDCFLAMPNGLTFYFVTSVPYADDGFEVFIPWEKVAAHLKPDGSHRLFQTKTGE